MTTPEWRQVTVTFPEPHAAEEIARRHIAPILTEAERRQLITSWFYVRKGSWRLRYAPAARYVANELERLADDHQIHSVISGVYEPETHAFGGGEAMSAAHQLWYADSRYLLLDNIGAAHLRETSIMLSAAMMRSASLDWYEQGDVWARVAAHRDTPVPRAVEPLLNGTRRLLTIDLATLTHEEAPLAGYQTLIKAYAAAGETLKNLKSSGQLHRGLREVLAHHVIFSWNRRGIPGLHQAALASAAKTVIFGPDPSRNALTPDGAS